ncbi:hypothetical protein a10_09295 [Streptomyces acidiscabies]|nr:hypothetical protein a10_09295 [Streptomyces acidiscabies]
MTTCRHVLRTDRSLSSPDRAGPHGGWRLQGEDAGWGRGCAGEQAVGEGGELVHVGGRADEVGAVGGVLLLGGSVAGVALAGAGAAEGGAEVAQTRLSRRPQEDGLRGQAAVGHTLLVEDAERFGQVAAGQEDPSLCAAEHRFRAVGLRSGRRRPPGPARPGQSQHGGAAQFLMDSASRERPVRPSREELVLQPQRFPPVPRPVDPPQPGMLLSPAEPQRPPPELPTQLTELIGLQQKLRVSDAHRGPRPPPARSPCPPYDHLGYGHLALVALHLPDHRHRERRRVPGPQLRPLARPVTDPPYGHRRPPPMHVRGLRHPRALHLDGHGVLVVPAQLPGVRGVLPRVDDLPGGDRLEVDGRCGGVPAPAAVHCGRRLPYLVGELPGLGPGVEAVVGDFGAVDPVHLGRDHHVPDGHALLQAPGGADEHHQPGLEPLHRVGRDHRRSPVPRTDLRESDPPGCPVDPAEPVHGADLVAGGTLRVPRQQPFHRVEFDVRRGENDDRGAVVLLFPRIAHTYLPSP